MKRFLSIFLTAILLLSLIPFSMFSVAAVESDEQGVQYTLSNDATYYIVSGYTGAKTSIEIQKTIKELPVTKIGDSAFYESNISSIVLTDSITDVGAEAFYNCDRLSYIENFENIKHIGYRAFYKCTALGGQLTFDSLDSIDDGAFYDCRKLSIINITNSVTKIGEYAFYNCNALTSIKIPETITKINDYAFFGCGSLTNLELPTSLTAIGNGAFFGCGSLTDIVIPNSVKSIGKFAFDSCYKATNIKIPDLVTFIGELAFYNCFNLTSISIPDSVKEIEGFAFGNCYNLTNIYCESNAKPDGWDSSWSSQCNAAVHWRSTSSVGQNLLSSGSDTVGTEGLEYTLSEDGKSYEITRYTGNASTLVIPSEYNGLPVTAISDLKDGILEGVFSGRKFTSVTLPDTLTDIGQFAFSSCSSLTEIEIPKAVVCISQGAFWGCDKLKSIHIPASVQTIEMGVLSGCSALETITVAPGNSKYRSVDNCLIDIEFKSVIAGTSESNIPNDGSVTRIYHKAFDYRTMNAITIPDTIHAISGEAFRGCEKLTSVVIPVSVEHVGWFAFADCDSLTDIYCEAESQPNDWDADWIYGCNATIHWGYTGLATEELSDAISDCDTLIESDYAKEEWTAIQAAIASAKDYDTEGKTAGEIRAEIDALENALLLNPKLSEFGDLDGNESIGATDYLLAKRSCFGTYELSNVENARADIDRSGTIDSIDYVLIKRIAFGTYTVG